MLFDRKEPSPPLRHLIKEFWIIENPETEPVAQKIIPDGYSEIILHYGDPYRINTSGAWEEQASMLYSNQFTHCFLLENTGASAMLGIKLFPTAFYQLFGEGQHPITDQVVDLTQLINLPPEIQQLTVNTYTTESRITAIEKWLSELPTNESSAHAIVAHIFEKNGLVGVEELAERFHISRRHLERLFQREVGLTPKKFVRIVKFSFIFQVMQEGDKSWVQIALQSGYFDQAHFIKNFKEFTGEHPSAYGFDETNMANFFLKK